MENANQIKSITEQILDELFEQLSKENEITHTMIDGLRALAKTGKMGDSEEIIRVISSNAGALHEID